MREPVPHGVVPAKAGTYIPEQWLWVPAFAGTTKNE